jgi:hypothetical protein
LRSSARSHISRRYADGFRNSGITIESGAEVPRPKLARAGDAANSGRCFRRRGCGDRLNWHLNVLIPDASIIRHRARWPSWRGRTTPRRRTKKRLEPKGRRAAAALVALSGRVVCLILAGPTDLTLRMIPPFRKRALA